MTTAYASAQGRPSASALGAGVDGVLDRIRTALKRHLEYRRTLEELRALSPRMLHDLDLDRGNLRAIARAEVRR